MRWTLSNTVVRRGLINWAAERPPAQLAFEGMLDSIPRDVEIFSDYICASCASAMKNCCARSAANSDVGINQEIPGIRQGQNYALDKLNRELTRVNCLLNVIVLNIRDSPDIARIFP